MNANIATERAAKAAEFHAKAMRDESLTEAQRRSHKSQVVGWADWIIAARAHSIYASHPCSQTYSDYVSAAAKGG